MRVPRVLMATPRYLPELGGTEIHVREVATRLAAEGVPVTVLTSDRTGALRARERVDGVEVVRVPARPRRSDVRFAPGVYELIRRGGWDLVHVQSYHTLVAPLAMAGALRAGTPYVVTFHGGGHSSSLRHRLRSAQLAALRPLLRRAAALVAIARFEVEAYGRALGVPRERFRVIPNGVDLAPAGAPAARTGTVIASVGRLERYKGHGRLVEALPHVLARRPDATLWIAGAGPDEPRLRRLARRLGVEGRVEIRSVPAGDRSRMAAELAGASLFALMSEFETHPLAALEALAVGTPVLAAHTSGLAELAEDGLARTVPLRSTPAELAEAVVEELERPRPVLAPQLPTWDDCAAGLRRLYEDVLAGRCAS